MTQYFREPKSLGKAKVELDLSNYAQKTDLKKATAKATSSFPKKVDLASLKSSVDKLGIDKLENIPTNLSIFIVIIYIVNKLMLIDYYLFLLI